MQTHSFMLLQFDSYFKKVLDEKFDFNRISTISHSAATNKHTHIVGMYSQYTYGHKKFNGKLFMSMWKIMMMA